MSQNPSISNCIYHQSPKHLVIKDQGTFTLRCSICYAQCIENIRSRHKQLLLTNEIPKPIILNEKSKSFFLEWSEQLIKTLTQAQYSNGPLEYITNFGFILSQHHNLIKAEKEQLNKLFSQVLLEQKEIFKGNIDFVHDLNPSQLTAELFLADLYNMAAQKAEDSLSIILIKFQTLLKQHAYHIGLRDWIQMLEKLQFNKNFGRRLIQSKQKTLTKYQKDIFFHVALPPLIQQNKKRYSKVPQVQKSPSIKTESIQSEQQSSNLLKQSEVIDRRAIVEDRQSSNERNIAIDIQSPIKKLQTPTSTPKNRIENQSKHQSPSVKSQNERTKSKLSTASGKKNELLQTQIHNSIIKEENQMSQDLHKSKNLGNKYPSHSQNIAKLSEIIKILNVQNKKLKNWKEGVVLQTTNFNKKIREITGLVQVLREVNKKENQVPVSDVDDQEKMINLLIEQYQQLISKHQSTLEQLFSKKKQNEGIKKQNKTLKIQVQQLNTKIKNLQKLRQQRLPEEMGFIQFPKVNINELIEQIQEYKQKIVNLKNENEAIKMKNLQEDSQIFLKTQRQIEDMTKINNQYLSMTKEKDRMLEEMQERYKKQMLNIQENMQKKQKQKEQTWQTQKNNLKQKSIQIAKLYEDEKNKNKYKEHQSFDGDAKRENLAMREELKVQKQKLLQALEVTRELVRLDQLKQRKIDELKEQLAKRQIQAQKLSNNLNRAQKLIIELGKEEENQMVRPRTLDQVKQTENEFLVINTSCRQNESISENKYGECQFESRICNLEKKVRQLEQELKVENNSYNDSLIEDLIETESEVKAKQFEINKFINLIEELLKQLPEEHKKKYQQKLHILNL